MDTVINPLGFTVILCDRALSVAGPRAWNALPADIRCALSLDTFKKRLKSHLFSAAYDL